MKRYYKLAFTLVLAVVFYSCERHPVEEIDISISADKFDFTTDDTVTFSFTGEAEFITFFSGISSESSYEEYPLSQGDKVKITKGEWKKIFKDAVGSINSTFIITNYGDNGQEMVSEQIDFSFYVTDTRTSVLEAVVRESGLGGEEYQNQINNTNATIIVDVPTGNDVSSLVTNLILTSKNAVLLNTDGSEFENNKPKDFTLGFIEFVVRAADGVTEKTWTIEINYI